MTTKNLITLAVVAVVLVGAAIYLKNGNKPVSPKLNGKKILPEFNVEDVSRIEIGDKLKLSAGNDGWTIETLYGYPADRDKIADNILKLIDLKVGQVARGRAIGDTSAVVLRDASGKQMADLKLGDKHVRQASGEAAMYGSYPDGRYIAFSGETVLVMDTLDAFDGDVKSWCSTRIASVQAGDVTGVTFVHGDDKTEFLKGTNGVWTLTGIAETNEIDTAKTHSLESVLSYVDFADVIDPALTPEELGFTTGYVCTVTTKDGKTYDAKVGNKVGDKRYFKLGDEKWNYTIQSYAAEKFMKSAKDFIK